MHLRTLNVKSLNQILRIQVREGKKEKIKKQDQPQKELLWQQKRLSYLNLSQNFSTPIVKRLRREKIASCLQAKTRGAMSTATTSQIKTKLKQVLKVWHVIILAADHNPPKEAQLGQKKLRGGSHHLRSQSTTNISKWYTKTNALWGTCLSSKKGSKC